MGVPGATVNLTAGVTADTFVEVMSANPAALMVEGQGVTVPAGFSSGPLLVDVLEGGASVPVSVTLGARRFRRRSSPADENRSYLVPADR